MQDLSELYESFTPEAAEEDADALSTGFFKWQAGLNHVRFLPATRGQRAPWIIAHQHIFTDPQSGDTMSANCPRVTPGMHDKTCMLCEAIGTLLRTGVPADRALAEKMSVGAVGYAKLIDRDHPGRGIQMVRLSPGVLKRLIEFRKEKQYNVDFTDPRAGLDVFVAKKGEGMGTRYTTELARGEPTPLFDDDESMLATLQASVAMEMSHYALPTLAAAHQDMVPLSAGGSGPSGGGHTEALPAPQTIDTTANPADADIPF